MMQIYERVRRCKYCNSDMTDTVSGMSYQENPFCDGCFQERVQNAAEKLGPGKWRRIPNTKYIEWVPDKAE